MIYFYLNPKEIYSYQTFPILKDKDIKIGDSSPQKEDIDNIQVFNNFKSVLLSAHNEEIDTNSLEDSKWAKYLLQEMYSIWFLVLVIKIKTNFFKPYYSQITDFSVALLNDLLTKKTIIFNKD